MVGRTVVAAEYDAGFVRFGHVHDAQGNAFSIKPIVRPEIRTMVAAASAFQGYFLVL